MNFQIKCKSKHTHESRNHVAKFMQTSAQLNSISLHLIFICDCWSRRSDFYDFICRTIDRYNLNSAFRKHFLEMSAFGILNWSKNCKIIPMINKSASNRIHNQWSISDISIYRCNYDPFQKRIELSLFLQFICATLYNEILFRMQVNNHHIESLMSIWFEKKNQH